MSHAHDLLLWPLKFVLCQTVKKQNKTLCSPLFKALIQYISFLFFNIFVMSGQVVCTNHIEFQNDIMFDSALLMYCTERKTKSENKKTATMTRVFGKLRKSVKH